MRLLPLIAAGSVFVGWATPAAAGPPYLTDDPVPTDPGHWEIYAFAAGEGHRATLDGDAGLDLNYGALPGVQLTATLPISVGHAPLEGWRSGSGDVELGVKYRFLHDEEHGLSAAIFPRAILPTAARSPGERTRYLLPVWVGKDFKGGTSLFGGGGLTINPGPGNRDYWQGGVALTQDVTQNLSFGAEITRQGPDLSDGTAQTRAGLGSIIRLSKRYAVLLSGGPTWADHRTSYRFYAALGIDL